MLEGVPLRQFQEKRTPYVPGYYRKRKMKAALMLLLIVVPIMLVVYCQEHSFNKNSSQSAIGNVRQMNSYEEALFFLRNCPGVQMDGDGDGKPCEHQFGK